MSATLEEAVKEAYASAPTDTIPLYTLEIMHPAFEVPVRVIRWPVEGPEPTKFQCRLEATAEYDAGQTVEFIGVPFELRLPEKSQDTPGEFTLTLPGAASELEQYLEQAALSGGRITARFRTYIKGRESEGPVELCPRIVLHSPQIDSTGNVSIQGSVLDWINRKFGRLITPGRYPALVGRS